MSRYFRGPMSVWTVSWKKSSCTISLKHLAFRRQVHRSRLLWLPHCLAKGTSVVRATFVNSSAAPASFKIYAISFRELWSERLWLWRSTLSMSEHDALGLSPWARTRIHPCRRPYGILEWPGPGPYSHRWASRQASSALLPPLGRKTRVKVTRRYDIQGRSLLSLVSVMASTPLSQYQRSSATMPFSRCRDA